MPAAAYTEKDAIFINTEGRVQYANKASFPPGEAREDWKIINQFSEVLELKWSFLELYDVRNEMFAKFPHLKEDFNDQNNGLVKIIDNKANEEVEIINKDTRSSQEKKNDTINGNIKSFEENSAKKIFNTAWTDLNDRQREYLRKYNYPETWSEFTAVSYTHLTLPTKRIV